MTVITEAERVIARFSKSGFSHSRAKPKTLAWKFFVLIDYALVPSPYLAWLDQRIKELSGKSLTPLNLT